MLHVKYILFAKIIKKNKTTKFLIIFGAYFKKKLYENIHL